VSFELGRNNDAIPGMDGNFECDIAFLDDPAERT